MPQEAKLAAPSFTMWILYPWMAETCMPASLPTGQGTSQQILISIGAQYLLYVCASLLTCILFTTDYFKVQSHVRAAGRRRYLCHFFTFPIAQWILKFILR